jgi:serine/threonine protein kinase
LKIKWYGVEGGYNVMVMEMLGTSLENLITEAGHPGFNLKTTITLADQLLCRLEFLHSKDYVFLDYFLFIIFL